MLTTESWSDIGLRMREGKTYDHIAGRFDRDFMPHPGDTVTGVTDLKVLGGEGLVVGVNVENSSCNVLWSRHPYRMPDINIHKTVINAQTKKLNVKWSVENANDIKAYHSMDAEDEIVRLIKSGIKRDDLLKAYPDIKEIKFNYNIDRNEPDIEVVRFEQDVDRSWWYEDMGGARKFRR